MKSSGCGHSIREHEWLWKCRWCSCETASPVINRDGVAERSPEPPAPAETVEQELARALAHLDQNIRDDIGQVYRRAVAAAVAQGRAESEAKVAQQAQEIARWRGLYEHADRLRRDGNEALAALTAERDRLKDLLAVECTCRAIEMCERCEVILNAALKAQRGTP